MRASAVLAVVLVLALLAVCVVADRDIDARSGSRSNGHFKDGDGVFSLTDSSDSNRYLRIKFKELEEIDANNNPVQGTKGFGGAWTFSSVQQTTLQGHSCRAVNLTADIRAHDSDTRVPFRSTFYLFDEDVSLTDGNSTNIVRVRVGDLKFTIHIGSWPFQSPANRLRLLAIVKTNDDGGRDIDDDDDDDDDSSSSSTGAPAPVPATSTSSSSTGGASASAGGGASVNRRGEEDVPQSQSAPVSASSHGGDSHGSDDNGSHSHDDDDDDDDDKHIRTQKFGKSGRMAVSSVTQAWIDGVYTNITTANYAKTNEFGVYYIFPSYTRSVEFDPVATIDAQDSSDSNNVSSASALCSSAFALAMAAFVALVARA